VKSSDFDEILYTAADVELDERHVIKNEKVALDRLRVRQNLFLVTIEFRPQSRNFMQWHCPSVHLSVASLSLATGTAVGGGGSLLVWPFWPHTA